MPLCLPMCLGCPSPYLLRKAQNGESKEKQFATTIDLHELQHRPKKTNDFKKIEDDTEKSTKVVTTSLVQKKRKSKDKRSKKIQGEEIIQPKKMEPKRAYTKVNEESTLLNEVNKKETNNVHNSIVSHDANMDANMDAHMDAKSRIPKDIDSASFNLTEELVVEVLNHETGMPLYPDGKTIMKGLFNESHCTALVDEATDQASSLDNNIGEVHGNQFPEKRDNNQEKTLGSGLIISAIGDAVNSMNTNLNNVLKSTSDNLLNTPEDIMSLYSQFSESFTTNIKADIHPIKDAISSNKDSFIVVNTKDNVSVQATEGSKQIQNDVFQKEENIKAEENVDTEEENGKKVKEKFIIVSTNTDKNLQPPDSDKKINNNKFDDEEEQNVTGEKENIKEGNNKNIEEKRQERGKRKQGIEKYEEEDKEDEKQIVEEKEEVEEVKEEEDKEEEKPGQEQNKEETPREEVNEKDRQGTKEIKKEKEICEIADLLKKNDGAIVKQFLAEEDHLYPIETSQVEYRKTKHILIWSRFEDVVSPNIPASYRNTLAILLKEALVENECQVMNGPGEENDRLLEGRKKANISMDQNQENTQFYLMENKHIARPDILDEILPFLYKYEGNLEKVKINFKAYLNFKRNAIPRLVLDNLQNALLQGMLYFRGRDKEDYPVVYFTMRNHNPKTRDIQTYLDAVIYRIEQHKDNICNVWKNRQKLKHKNGETETFLGSNPFNADSITPKVTVVVDRYGTTISNQDIELYKSLFSLFNNYYPERLNRVLVIPANMVFKVLWAALRMGLSTKDQEKLIMLSDKRDLLNYIKKEELPTHLDGQDTFKIATDSVDDFRY